MSALSSTETRLFDSWSLPVMILDHELRFLYANQSYLDATHRVFEDIFGHYVFDVFPDEPERVDLVLEKFKKTLDGKVTILDAQPFKLELPDGSEKEIVWQATQDPLRDQDGKIIGLIQHAADITQQYQLEQRHKAIGHELSHRVKNIMALVNSVARITGRKADNVEDFVKRFTARIGAMSRTNDLLAESDWKGLEVKSIFKDELAPFHEKGKKTISLFGPSVRLTIDASKDLSMVCHELATNAVKYGCLGNERGSLTVKWKLDGKTLIITWKESCPHEIDEPGETGFGTRLFDMLPYVEVEREFTPNGLHMTISMDGEKAFA